MKKRNIIPENEIVIKNIEGYFERTVTKFGTGAKVDIPKSYLNKKVIILVRHD